MELSLQQQQKFNSKTGKMDISVFSTTDLNQTQQNKTDFRMDIAFVDILVLSIVADLIIIYTTFKCISTLNRIEFILLMTMEISLIPHKIILILFYLSFYRSFVLFGFYTLVINVFLLLNTIFIRSMILFYFSIYHLTFLKLTRLFQTMSNSIRKQKNFIIYMIVVSIYSLIATSLGLILPILEFSSRDQIYSTYKLVPNHIFILMFHFFVPALFSPIVYSIATFITCYSRFRLNRCLRNQSYLANTSKNRKLRKHFKIFITFLSIVIFGLISIIPKMIYIILSFNCGECFYNLKPMNYTSDGLIMVSPIFLVIVHKILRKKLVSILDAIFNKIGSHFKK